MQQPQKIEFRKERDFSSVLGDSLKFLKQNFKPFFASIILIIGPFILLTGLAYSYMQTVIMSASLSGRATGMSLFNADYFASLGVIYLLLFINNVLLNSVIFNYMGLYHAKPFGEKITVSEVASKVWSNIGRVLGSMLMFILVLIVAIIAIALIMFGFSSMGVFGGILVGLTIVFGALILGPVILYYISAGFYVVVRDESFIFQALGKVKSYLSGNFWWTWLIMVVVFIALGILQFLFNLPATIITMTEIFTRLRHVTENGVEPGSGGSVWLIVFYTIGMFLTTCSSSILHLACAFNFLSQEEKHEGKGLLSRMEEIK